MTKLEQKLQEIKARKKIGLMTHIVIGYPSLEKTVTLVKTMAESGVDLIELQIPFSDPIADGPTIMRACEKSLKNGTKVKDAFTIMKLLSSQVSIPLLFMAYYNTVFKYGVEKFCKDTRNAGASGLIVPDMSIDEEREEHFLSFCKKYQLHNIQVVSPVSTNNRLKKNARVASGFVYCTARQGITGVKNKLDPSTVTYLRNVKKHFSVPIAVGFGLSKRKHIDLLGSYAHIAVVGSALIEQINTARLHESEAKIANFIKNLEVTIHTS